MKRISPAYEVDALARGLDLLEALGREDAPMRLRDLVSSTGLHKATAFRMLRTLESRGWVERVGRFGYRPLASRRKAGNFRIGYASRDERLAFPRAVTGSLRMAAQKEGIELLVLDNQTNRKKTIRNAESMIQAKVDLAVEFSTDEAVTAEVAARLSQVGIPIISIDQPMAGAFFFGADNYHAGLAAGRALGGLIPRKQAGEIEEIVLLKDGGGGSIVSSRLTGAMAGVEEARIFRGRPAAHYLDGKGTFEGGLRAMRGHLRVSKARRRLVIAMNDPSALGAIHAIEEAGSAQLDFVAAVGGGMEIRKELRRPGTPLVVATGLFPEAYGQRIVEMALRILGGKHVPPAAFTPHQALTRSNVDRVYPNDSLYSNV